MMNGERKRDDMVRTLMLASTSVEDWNMRCAKIRKSLGFVPPIVVHGGLFARARLNWEATDAEAS